MAARAIGQELLRAWSEAARSGRCSCEIVKGHGGTGHKAGLPIGCGQGRETDRYMECCRLAQRDMAGRVGRHRAILSRDLKITKKRRKSAITLFSRLMTDEPA
jgi:hypothetical protein